MIISFTKKVKNEIEMHVDKLKQVDISKISYDKVEIKKDLRVKFLNHGAICNPSSTYHFEYRFKNIDVANITLRELSTYGISGKLSMLKDGKRNVVYLTDALTIIKVLKLLGATDSLKEYVKVYEYKNTVKDTNRKVNFETANIKKTVDKSLKQLDDIKKLLKIKKLQDLDEELKVVVRARQKYPTLSLADLAKKIGNISKSTINHRMMKIRKMIGE